MLAAGIPVIAYNAPGPCDILPKKWLVKSGDIEGMTQKLMKQIKEQDTKEAQKIASYFCWTNIGQETIKSYQKAIDSLQ